MSTQGVQPEWNVVSSQRENGEAVDADHALAAAAMRGDRSAMAALWIAHRRWIAAVLLAYKPPGIDVEDLLQEVAMTLVTKINTLRETSNVRAWLRTVAINAARAAGRTERARPALRLVGTQCEVPAETVRSERGGTLDDHAQRVLALAANLPDTYREPLMLKAVHGMRSRQISEILGIPEATVDTRVSRARRMLREQARLGHGDDGGIPEQLSGPLTVNGAL